MKRIVITGVGMINALGSSCTSFNSIVQGQCGVDKITLCNTDDLLTKIAAEVKEFDATTVMKKREVKKADRFIQLGLHAAIEAFEDARLEHVDVTDFGVVSTNCMTGLSSVESAAELKCESGLRHTTPFLVPSYLPNMLGGQVSIRFKMSGPNLSTTSACAAGTHGIIEAFKTLQFSQCEGMMVVGAEAPITPLSIAGYGAMNALSKRNDDPQRASRPYDSERDGFVLGEGAGALVVETLEHAERRGAKIYAEIIGFGESADAHHITAPHPEGKGAKKALRLAWEMAGKPKIDYINSHGTSTPHNDIDEAKAIHGVFGEMFPYVSSTKGQTGHCLGAAGVIEAVISLLAIEHQILPPIINYTKSEAKMQKINLVKNKAIHTKVETVLSCNFGFGGTNGAVVFQKFDG